MSATVTDKRSELMADLIAKLGAIRTVSVLVGIRSAKGADLIKYAAANEFGTRRIPARSFLRAIVDLNRKVYIGMLHKAAERLLNGDPPDQAIGIVGAVAVGDVQRRIRNRIPPPNAPYTIAKKGSDVPLIDTGRLRQSIDYTVELA